MRISFFSLAGGVALLIAGFVSVAQAAEKPPIVASGDAAYSTNSPKEAANYAVNLAQEKIKSLIPSLGGDAPEWAKRIELDARFGINDDPRFSVLTVQPLYQSAGQVDTVFTQVSFQRYDLYGEDRNTINTGLGYRRLLDDKNALVGANVFYDYELDHNHSRIGFGTEAKWGPLDGWFNYYLAASGDKNIGGVGIVERAVSGYDVRAAGQVPYLPWAKLNGAYYHWDKIKAADDTDGYDVNAEVAIHPNLTLEAGHKNDNNNPGQYYFLTRFQLAGSGASLLGGGQLISSKVFEKRDLTGETLKKVRRENRIILERTTPATGGVTVTVVRG